MNTKVFLAAAPILFSNWHFRMASCYGTTYILEIIKIFYKNSKDVGMAQKVQKQVKAVTQ